MPTLSMLLNRPFRHLFLCCLGVMAITAHPVHATRTSLEGVVAVVDGTPILFSDLEELRQAMLAQRPGFSQLPVAQQRKQILDRLVDEKVLIAKAKQDTTIKVTDKDVDARADEWYQRLVQQQGGEKQLETALQQATGMSLGQFKARIKDQTRDQIYRQRLQMKFVGDPEPSQLQVQDFFSKYKDSLPIQRDGIRLSHIQWRIKANRQIDSAARAEVEAIIARLDKGESFSEMAKARSEDYSGKEGGDLGYIKRGTLDADYERAAYALEVGDYTPRPIRTRFGYHIIRVTGKKDNEIRTSHILIKVVPTGDTARALAFTDSLGKTLKTDKDFENAAKSISEDRQTRELGGDLGWFQQDSLNTAYKEIVDALPEGGVTPAILMGDSYHLFRVMRKVTERHLSLEEDYTLVSQYAKEMLINQKLAGLTQKWREHIAIENRMAQFKGLDDMPSEEGIPVDNSQPSGN